MSYSQTPQATSSSITNEMLLAYPSTNSHSSASHHGHLCHHHNQNAIRTPSKHSSPMMASMSLAESSFSSPSNSLIIDNMGELHDPSYMSALRSLHAEIGNRTSPKPEGRRRPSSSHAPQRPSQLGLFRGSPRDDDEEVSDSDSDYSDDDDNVYSIRSRSQDFSSRGNRSDSLASSTRPSFSHSYRVSSNGSQSQIAPTPPRTPPPPSAYQSNIASRHLSMSSYDNDNVQLPKEKTRRASWAFRRKHDNSSPSSTPRSNALPLTQEADKKANGDSWGFTGFVDIEREQRAARESLEEQEESQAAPATVAPSRWSSKSMRRKGSNGSTEAKSLGVSLHSNGNNFLPWSNGQDKKLNRHASMSSLRQDEPRTYSTVDSKSFGLSTIMSGLPTTTFDGRSDSRSTLSDTTTYKHNQVQKDLQQQREEADFILGPSKYKQMKDSLHGKSSDEDPDAPSNHRDLRRKMESMALGVRFGAFNVKRKIERGIKG